MNEEVIIKENVEKSFNTFITDLRKYVDIINVYYNPFDRTIIPDIINKEVMEQIDGLRGICEQVLIDTIEKIETPNSNAEGL